MSDPMLTLDTDTDDRPRKRRRVLLLTLSAVGAVLLAAVTSLLLLQLLNPQLAEKVIGDGTTTLRGAIDKAVEPMVGPPAVTLGQEGTTEDDLDWAPNGVFLEMTSYRAEGVPPVFAAHNNHGGDIILTWEVGQAVTVIDQQGQKHPYVVTAISNKPKHSTYVSDLVGLPGPLVLQSCYYGEELARYVSLTPATSGAGH
jgi:hypothetical protein